MFCHPEQCHAELVSVLLSGSDEKGKLDSEYPEKSEIFRGFQNDNFSVKDPTTNSVNAYSRQVFESSRIN